jgi:putative endonuclease
MKQYQFFVYIIASKSGTLYVGVTSDLVGRVYQHKHGTYDGFSKKYQCHILLYHEEFQYVYDALAREKQLKKWNRRKKEDIIKILNPCWRDLASDWHG